MISLNDVLLAMSNIPVDDPIAEIWGRGLQSGYKIIEYTGTLPITINANGDALLDYRIYGADGGVGEPTENLFDGQGTNNYGYYDNANGRYINDQNYKYWRFSVKKDDVIRWTITGAGYGCYFSNGVYKGRLYTGSTPFTVPADIDEVTNNFDTSVLDSAMVTKNQPLPETYVPYGYKLPMTVMDNLAPPLSQWVNGYIRFTDGAIVPITGGNEERSSDFIEVKSNTQYVFSIEGGTFPQGTSGAFVGIGMYHDDQTFITRHTYYKTSPYTFLTPNGTKYVRLSYRSYGELLEPRLSENSFSIHIYIGENQLTEGEYVSYGEQKIYRDVSGTLTPTDPPVSIPQIPTIDGTTVIDYDGEPKPSQMYVKYKGKSGGA